MRALVAAGAGRNVESFEQFVAVALESEGLVVSEAVKFPVQRITEKRGCEERQTYGYEVDLIGARADRLVLATVKSFLGSPGGRVGARYGNWWPKEVLAPLHASE